MWWPCMAMSHSISQCPRLQAAGHPGAVPSFSWHRVCAQSQLHVGESRGTLALTFRAACTDPSKGMQCRPGQPDHQIQAACSFSRDWHGLYSPKISWQLEQPVANSRWLLVLLKQGQLPGQRIEPWQLLLQRTQHITAKAEREDEVLQILSSFKLRLVIQSVSEGDWDQSQAPQF